MKSLKESLFDSKIQTTESLFDNNLDTKTPTLHGFEVDDKTWKECKKSFKWFKRNIVKNGTVEYEELGLRSTTHNVIYDEDDCIMWVPKNGNREALTIISPETIWYNYVNGALGYIQTQGDEVDLSKRRTGIYCMTFAKRKDGDFYRLEYVDGNGYIPETISDKAKKIIEKY